MKKSIAMLLALVLALTAVLAIVPTASAAVYGDVAVVISSRPTVRVNLRSRPRTSSSSLGLYYQGAEATVLEDLGTWMEIRIGDTEGYMMSKFLATGSDVSKVESYVPTGIINNKKSGNYSLLRKAASSRGAILDRFLNSELMEILGTRGSYYHVHIADQYGYIMKSLVTNMTGIRYALVNNPYTTQMLNLRSEPFEMSESYGLFYNGSRVFLLSDVDSDGWAEVQIGEMTGYMKAQYLYFTNSKTAIRTRYRARTVRTSSSSSYLNMRAEPDMDATILYRYRRGTRMYVIGNVGQWYYVKVGTRLGYVMAQYLR